MPNLTEAKVKTLPPGRHGCGDGLWLDVGGGRTWSLRYTLQGKARQMGLGAWPGVTLAEARQRAADARAMVRNGQDPIEVRRDEKTAKAVAQVRQITFAKAAADYIATNRAGWRNLKHATQWDRTIATYVTPVFGNVPVSEVTTDHVLRALKPIWHAKPETAVRVRGRIETVLAAAIALGWCKEPNVARWHNHLQMILPPRSKLAPVEHHASIPWQEMQAFMAALRNQNSVGAMALEFLILTAARSGEVRGATWEEIDIKGANWTVPAARMKANRDHVVPLSPPALAVLRRIAALGDQGIVFPGMRAGQPLSDMSLTAVLRRMGRGEFTAHGFRASFKTWASDETTHARELIEASLAHAVGDRAEQTYQRGVWLDRRRALMNDWATFCGSKPAAAIAVPVEASVDCVMAGLG
jgi:integrase